MTKHKDNNNVLFKRALCMSPEGDGTQDAKASLASLDATCKCAKQEHMWNNVNNVTILCDNAGTYSAVVFHVATFDVVKSHGLNLIGLTHNDAQDGKTELDFSFSHFKLHLKKNILGRQNAH